MRASILVPSYRRPAALVRCLSALAIQSQRAEEVIVVWQGGDQSTRDVAESLRPLLGEALRVLHLPIPGIVPAENLALEASTGEVVLLIDDDAVPGPDWVAKHVAHYADPSVGAVGGPAVNYRPDGTPFPIRDRQPQGRVSLLGRLHGNMYDHPQEWRRRGVIEVDHLVGYNMSLRRSAFDRFEDQLRAYWQLFELDACLTVKRSGFRVVFDYGIVVEHHPTNAAFVGGRDGDLEVKVFNPTYNRAFVLAKHSSLPLACLRFVYLLAVGTTGGPGVVASIVAIARGGGFAKELRVLARCWEETIKGWIAGRRWRR